MESAQGFFRFIKTIHELMLFQSCNFLCYTREQVKIEDNEIVQPQTMSLYKHLLYHPRIIPHASMYHPNLSPCSYATPLQLQSIQPCHIAQHRNTFPPILMVLNLTATLSPGPRAITASLNVSVSLLHKFLPHLLGISACCSYVHPYCFSPFLYPPLRFQVFRECSRMVAYSHGIRCGPAPPLPSHSQSLQVPRSMSLTQSTA
jgi:hypothetical protein